MDRYPFSLVGGTALHTWQRFRSKNKETVLAGARSSESVNGEISGSTGFCLWKTKMAFAAGLGVPLAIIVAGDPAAAEPADLASDDHGLDDHGLDDFGLGVNAANDFSVDNHFASDLTAQFDLAFYETMSPGRADYVTANPVDDGSLQGWPTKYHGSKPDTAGFEIRPNYVELDPNSETFNPTEPQTASTLSRGVANPATPVVPAVVDNKADKTPAGESPLDKATEDALALLDEYKQNDEQNGIFKDLQNNPHGRLEDAVKADAAAAKANNNRYPSLDGNDYPSRQDALDAANLERARIMAVDPPIKTGEIGKQVTFALATVIVPPLNAARAVPMAGQMVSAYRFLSNGVRTLFAHPKPVLGTVSAAAATALSTPLTTNVTGLDEGILHNKEAGSDEGNAEPTADEKANDDPDDDPDGKYRAQFKELVPSAEKAKTLEDLFQASLLPGWSAGGDAKEPAERSEGNDAAHDLITKALKNGTPVEDLLPKLTNPE